MTTEAVTAKNPGQHINAELIRLIYADTPLSLAVTLIVGSVLATVLWPVSNHVMLITWLGGLFTVSAARLVLTCQFKKNSPVEEKLQPWKHAYLLGVGLAGITWGAAGSILFPVESPIHQVFLGFVLGGMAVGGSYSLSAIRPAYIIFVLTSLLPYLMMLLMLEGELHQPMALMFFVFTMTMLIISFRINKSITDTIHLKLDNSSLGDNLQEEKAIRKQTENKLNESEQRFRDLSDAAFEGIIIHDQGTILDVNTAFANMSGYTPEELAGMTMLQLAAPESHDLLKYRLQNLADSPFEAIALHKDGSKFPVEIRGHYSPYKGKVLRVATLRDISHQKETEWILREAKEKAESADRTKGAVLSSVSHELRTPLNAVLGFAQLLEQSSLDDEQREYLEQIHASGKSLLELINDMLSFIQIESGNLSIEPQAFDMCSLTNDIANILNFEFKKENVQLVINCPEDMPGPLVGDSGIILQIILKLMENAFKFTHKGYVCLNVRAEEHDNDFAQLRISIEDTGIGIPEENIHSIFDHFTQGDSSHAREFGGTGLGLSICKGLVDKMGGKIGIESEVGVGTTVWFQLDLPLNRQLEFEAM